jgi:acetylserotonin N-methyltransferase
LSSLPTPRDDSAIWDNWLSVYRFPVVTVADAVGIFPAISAQALTTAELAAKCDVDARALSIHLGLLAALGFVERRENRWRASATARTWLHPEAEGYYGPLLHRYREGQPLHSQLLATLLTGDKAQGHLSAAEEWERGEMPPELAQQLTGFMNAVSRAGAQAVAQQSQFADLRTILDVGGGSGIYSIEMAKAWSGLSATIMEIPQVCVVAEPYITRSGMGARVRTQAVNMFTQDWPRDYDAHFLSNIFHDWSDATNRLLAKKSFAALPKGGRILLHEMLMNDDGCGPLPAAAFSMLMLLATRGKQYSLPEVRSILEDAGFSDVQSAQTGGGYYSLVSARKA